MPSRSTSAILCMCVCVYVLWLNTSHQLRRTYTSLNGNGSRFYCIDEEKDVINKHVNYFNNFDQDLAELNNKSRCGCEALWVCYVLCYVAIKCRYYYCEIICSYVMRKLGVCVCVCFAAVRNHFSTHRCITTWWVQTWYFFFFSRLENNGIDFGKQSAFTLSGWIKIL